MFALTSFPALPCSTLHCLWPSHPNIGALLFLFSGAASLFNSIDSRLHFGYMERKCTWMFSHAAMFAEPCVGCPERCINYHLWQWHPEAPGAWHQYGARSKLRVQTIRGQMVGRRCHCSADAQQWPSITSPHTYDWFPDMDKQAWVHRCIYLKSGINSCTFILLSSSPLHCCFEIQLFLMCTTFFLFPSFTIFTLFFTKMIVVTVKNVRKTVWITHKNKQTQINI